jgi:hypothetical protein
MDHTGLLTGLTNRNCFFEFFRKHPVATLPVPGPILPILQALCVSSPQDGTLPRVTPRFPDRLGPNQANQLIRDAFNYALPNIPMIFGLHQALSAEINGQVNNVYNDVNTVLTHMGYEGNASTANVTINGTIFAPGFAGNTADAIWATTCPGIGMPIELNDELLSAFRSNQRFLRLPTLQGVSATRDLAEFTRVLDGPWFASLKRNMSVYCRFVKGSGTMQDVSVEGPTAAQIVANVSTLGITIPNGFFTRTNSLPGDATYITTQAANDRIGELTIVYSQIHSRITNHPHGRFNNIGSEDQDNGRNGTFWDIRPIRPPTNPDFVKDSLAEEIAFYVRERADRD